MRFYQDDRQSDMGGLSDKDRRDREILGRLKDQRIGKLRLVYGDTVYHQQTGITARSVEVLGALMRIKGNVQRHLQVHLSGRTTWGKPFYISSSIPPDVRKPWWPKVDGRNVLIVPKNLEDAVSLLSDKDLWDAASTLSPGDPEYDKAMKMYHGAKLGSSSRLS